MQGLTSNHLEILCLDDMAPNPRQICTKAQESLNHFAGCRGRVIEAGAGALRAIHDALMLPS